MATNNAWRHSLETATEQTAPLGLVLDGQAQETLKLTLKARRDYVAALEAYEEDPTPETGRVIVSKRLFMDELLTHLGRTTLQAACEAAGVEYPDIIDE